MPKSIKTASKFHEHSVKIEAGWRFRALWLTNCAKGGFRTRPSYSPLDLGTLFGENCGRKGRLWDPMRFEDCSHFDLLATKWRSGPPKMLFGMCFGNNMGNWRKHKPTIVDFECKKHAKTM